jgi:hypothetical protein
MKKSLDVVTKHGKPRLLTGLPLPGENTNDKLAREQKFPLHLLAQGLQVKLEEGKASWEEDTEQILRSLATDGGQRHFSSDALEQHLKSANSRLRGFFAIAAWPQAFRMGIVERFPVTAVEGADPTVSLPGVLAEDLSRKDLTLILDGLNVKDDDIATIARGLPINLQSLRLSFEGCEDVTDKGLAALAEALDKEPCKSSIKKLRVDFSGCIRVSDEGVSFLGSKLPRSVKKLKLNFSLCHGVGWRSVRMLALKLPASVSELEATFTGTMCGRIFKSPRELKNSLKRNWLKDAVHKAGEHLSFQR